PAGPLIEGIDNILPICVRDPTRIFKFKQCLQGWWSPKGSSSKILGVVHNIRSSFLILTDQPHAFLVVFFSEEFFKEFVGFFSLLGIWHYRWLGKKDQGSNR